ncbi:MAG TPA: tetratricopeptide repeat protein [Pyrinomonadaceae bacterium]
MANVDQLKLFDVSAPLKRALLLAPLLIAALCSWYGVRWYLGNTLAEVAPGMEEGGLDTAQLALRLAPDDPLTHWTKASLEKRTLLTELMPQVVPQYEKAVSLSPNEYRLWMDLGVAREQAGDRAGGELALRRAVELAPWYADPRWFLGNLLLRAGNYDEAFRELRRASEANPATYRPQVFNVAWQVFGQDTAAMQRAVGETPAVRAALAAFLLERGRETEALSLWSSLRPAEKREQRDIGQGLFASLLGKNRYRAAQGLARDLAGEGFEAGQFQNGGFESNEERAGASNAFGWQLQSVSQAKISFDPQNAHGGSRSLRVLFNASANLGFNLISQTIVVEPSTQYRLECYVRTDDLKTASAPLLEVVDLSDNALLAASKPLPVGTNDWQSVTFDFKTTAKTEAIVVRTNRAPCNMEGAACPIFGTIWYDDFNLQRLGANAQPGNSSGGSGNVGAREGRTH